ncbi:7-cyano-7-deazaguanine synthase [Frankia tisae]|uniref:7-cyano-7-deazaguanine synthase n=1 Tax=Frankia tisae TaxID=2950104 RepID=UPI0021C08B2F|nr:7-cyano-7-deazaguanine synthase [Frankia tisae]
MADLNRGYRRDDNELADDDGYISPVVSDLLDIATDAFLKDREQRRGRVGEPSWHRSLTLMLRVRCLDLWTSVAVRDALIALLEWLTGDDWHLTFDGTRPDNVHHDGQIRLPLDDHVDDVVLFSGGLDATAGIAHLLASGRYVMAIGVVTNTAMIGYQRKVVRALRRDGAGRVDYRPISLASLRTTDQDESTRRTRGLVFLAAGVAAAVAAGHDRLLMLENGIGAINLPYTAAQWGAMTSRAAHPRTLVLMGELLKLVLERPVEVANPHIGQTKGQMVQALPEWAGDSCASSESCDNAAAGRGRLERRCGECTSCLLRRVSFAAADRSHWDLRPYRADVHGPRPNRDRSVEMLWQVAALDRALRDPDPGELSRWFPALRHVPVDILDPPAQRRLLATYVEEWRRYPDPRVSSFLDSEPLEEVGRSD